MTVRPEFCNVFGSLNGGAVATIIDISTSILASMVQEKFPLHVSLALTSNMLRNVQANEEVYILNKIDKMGKEVVFLSADLYSESGKLCYTTSHLKHFVKKVQLNDLMAKL